MGNFTCIDDGCDEVATRRHLCNRHYRARKRKGLELPPYMVKPDPSYITMHERLGNASALACASCGSTAHDWAYDNSDPDELIDRSMGLRYSTDPARYSPMCRGCHIRFDRPRQPCGKDHPWNPEDSKCRECAKERADEKRAVVRQAAAALGLGFKEYVATHTASQEVAKRVIASHRD